VYNHWPMLALHAHQPAAMHHDQGAAAAAAVPSGPAALWFEKQQGAAAGCSLLVGLLPCRRKLHQLALHNFVPLVGCQLTAGAVCHMAAPSSQGLCLQHLYRCPCVPSTCHVYEEVGAPVLHPLAVRFASALASIMRPTTRLRNHYQGPTCSQHTQPQVHYAPLPVASCPASRSPKQGAGRYCGGCRQQMHIVRNG
jgi:hypothetical protein